MRLLGASKAHRWTQCGLSTVFRGRALEQPAAADEGTAAHWAAEIAMASGESAEGKTSPGGYIITKEMAAHVEDYVNTVTTVDGYREGYQEHSFCVGDYVQGQLDFAAVLNRGNTIRVTEFKYGWRIVEPYYNLQLILAAYAMGQEYPQADIFELAVFQPRPFHPDGPHRVWITSRAVIENMTNWILESAEAAQAPEKLLSAKPGSHCRDCHGLAQCASAARNIYEMTEYYGYGDIHNGNIGEELQFLRDAKLLIDSRLTAIETEMEFRMTNGQYVRGWTLTRQYGNRCFKKGLDIEAFGAFTGIRMTKQTPRSPADLEKDGVSRRLLDEITYRPVIKTKLTPVTTATLTRVFENANAVRDTHGTADRREPDSSSD